MEPSATPYTIAAMRRWSELAERVAATTQDVREDGAPRRVPRGPDARRAPDRGRLPDRPAVPRGRPARDRRRAGRRSAAPCSGVAGRRPRGPAPRPTTARRTWRSRWRDVLAEAGHAPDPATEPSLTEVAAAFAAIEAASGPAAKARSCATSSPGRRPAHRQRASSRSSAASSGSGSARASRGRDRQGVRPPARRRQVGRDADRRRRARPRRSPARTGSTTPSLALFHPLKFMLASPAEDAAEILAPPRARRSGSRTSTTASARSSTAPGDEVRLYSRDLHDISGQFPEVVAGARGPRLGRDPRRRAAGLARRRGPAVPALQARLGRKYAVGGDPRRDPGDLRRVGTCWGSTPTSDGRSSRC